MMQVVDPTRRLAILTITRMGTVGMASPAGYGRLWTGDVQRRILLAA
jgi:hypothetical protein